MQNDNQHDPGKENAKLGRKSLLPIVTVNKKFAKIYFSVRAVKDLALLENRFRIFKEDDAWFISAVSGEEKLTIHQGAFYFVNRKLVSELMKDFLNEDPLRLVIERSDRQEAKYLLQLVGAGMGKAKGSGKKSSGARFSSGDVSMKGNIGSAKRMMEVYQRTQFVGRIKTIEILKAEGVLNRNHKIQ